MQNDIEIRIYVTGALPIYITARKKNGVLLEPKPRSINFHSSWNSCCERDQVASTNGKQGLLEDLRHENLAGLVNLHAKAGSLYPSRTLNTKEPAQPGALFVISTMLPNLEARVLCTTLADLIPVFRSQSRRCCSQPPTLADSDSRVEAICSVCATAFRQSRKETGGSFPACCQSSEAQTEHRLASLKGKRLKAAS